MKVLIFSDIHGSSKGAFYMEQAINLHKPDRIVLLGDLLNYSSGEVSSLIYKYKDIVIAVEGNCDDALADEQLLGISLPRYNSFVYLGHTVHMSHTLLNLSFSSGDIVLFGHTHVKTLFKDKDVLFLNPGSISNPRDSSASYALLENNEAILFDAVDNSIICKEIL